MTSPPATYFIDEPPNQRILSFYDGGSMLQILIWTVSLGIALMSAIPMFLVALIPDEGRRAKAATYSKVMLAAGLASAALGSLLANAQAGGV
jgi:hypothetical protein